MREGAQKTSLQMWTQEVTGIAVPKADSFLRVDT